MENVLYFYIDQFPQREVLVSPCEGLLLACQGILYPINIGTLGGLPRRRKQLQYTCCGLPITCLLLYSCLVKREIQSMVMEKVLTNIEHITHSHFFPIMEREEYFEFINLFCLFLMTLV